MKKVIGILAHVDAGKTTFSEQALFAAHAIRKLGRVDHGDAFLDAHPLEKQRGITIFSDQAWFSWKGNTYTWVDTPGHVDFSPEMERAISVMDAAVIVISAVEGVQSHTESIWKLLKDFHVPAMLFINKMDRPGADLNAVLEALKKRLSPDIVLMCSSQMDESLQEAVAERDAELLDAYLEGAYDEARWRKALTGQVMSRQIFPALSGSALKGEGIEALLDALDLCVQVKNDEDAPFSGLVYKVRHDPQGERVCHMKVLSGKVRVREEIDLPDGGKYKITELRRMQGSAYDRLQEAAAGDVIACPGLPGAMPGDRVGVDAARRTGYHLEPMMAVSVVLPPAVRADEALRALKTLEDEEPTLSVTHNPVTSSIDVSVMGPIQLEVLRQLMRDRFQLDVDFGPMRIMYMETVKAPAYGIGHYEPLRHYAEVHVRLVPGSRGSGIRFESLAHVDDLALNWQRLIETHVFEKTHRGVLIGAPLTDVTVQLVRGRAHIKHTEGGDFRESVYRAIRNALMYAESELLEPICRFSLTAPQEAYGRVMGDLQRLHAAADAPTVEGETFTVTGCAAFADFLNYPTDFLQATHGRGALSYHFDHYAPARNQSEIIAEAKYNPLAEDTPDSVFCVHGAGFTVPWNEVKSYAHLPVEE